MAPNGVPPDLREFLKLLKSHGVKYLLIGGYAVAYHGYARTTDDMDVWVASEPENARRLVFVLEEFGFDASNLPPDVFLDPNRMVRMGNPPNRLELLTSISGVVFSECYESKITDMIDGVEVDVIDLESLKRNKIASGRPKDLEDLQRLD